MMCELPVDLLASAVNVMVNNEVLYSLKHHQNALCQLCACLVHSSSISPPFILSQYGGYCCCTMALCHFFSPVI